MKKRYYQINELKPGLKLIQKIDYNNYNTYQRFYHIYKISKIQSLDEIYVKGVDLKLREFETIFEFEVWWNEIRDIDDLKDYRKLRINETFSYRVNNNIR